MKWLPSPSSSSSSSSESSGQDSGVELLSVTWLWPEGWSLALRSRRSGPGPWRETSHCSRGLTQVHHSCARGDRMCRPWGQGRSRRRGCGRF